MITMTGTTNASASTRTSCLGVLIGDSRRFPLIWRLGRASKSAHYSGNRRESPIKTPKQLVLVLALAFEELIDRALAEDIGFADLTSELVIPADARAELALNARQDIVVAGIEVAAQVFRRRVPQCRVELRVKDGDRVNAGTAMGRIEGPARG